MGDGTISEENALWISFMIWMILFVARALGYNDMITTSLITVSAFLFGFLAHKLGFPPGSQPLVSANT